MNETETWIYEALEKFREQAPMNQALQALVGVMSATETNDGEPHLVFASGVDVHQVKELMSFLVSQRPELVEKQDD